MKLMCMLKWLCLYLLLLMLQARKLAEAEKSQAASRLEKQAQDAAQLQLVCFAPTVSKAAVKYFPVNNLPFQEGHSHA